MFSYQTLSTLLRGLGIVVLVTSLSILLFQGWDNGTDMTRFYTLLAYSGILAAIGFLVSRFVRENKGARTFLALAVGAVAVNYTVLGALFFSAFSEVSINYPSFAAWTAPGGFAAAGALAAALFVLTPITYLGFLVFARQSARRLTVLYVLSNLALLVPVRSSLVIGFLGLALAAFAIHQITVARRTDTALLTREGHMAIGVQIVPILILLGRNFYLYAVDEILLTLTAFIAYVVTRRIAVGARNAEQQTSTTLLESTQVASALAVTGGVVSTLCSVSAAATILIPVSATLFAGLLADISLTSSTRQGAYRRAAAMVLASCLTVNLVVFPSLAAALAAIVAGLLVAVYGYSAEQKSAFTAGVVTLLGGVGYQLYDVAQLFDFGSWTSLAVVGIASIVLASLLERFGVSLRERALAWRNQFSQWEH